MDINEKVEVFLSEWANLSTEEIYERLTHEMSSFKKQKNVGLYLKLIIIKLEKRIKQMRSNKKNLSLIEKGKISIKIKKDTEKINCIKKLYQDYKDNFIEEKEEKEINKILSQHEEISFDKESKESINLTDIDLEDFDLKEAIGYFAKIIKECDLNSDNVIKNTDYLCDNLVEYLFYNKQIFNEFYLLLDALKYRVNMYDKDSDERKIIKNIQKRFKDIYVLYKEVPDNKKVSPYFNIINYWLQDDKNYLFIKELLKRQPEVYNCYNGDQHIVIYLIDQYIDNFKKMIVDKNGTYINKNYIKEVYFLFTKSYKARLTNEQKEEIDNKLKEFNYYVKNALIKEKRKNAAINEIKTMKTVNYYQVATKYQFREFSSDCLSYEQQRILNYSNDMVKNSLALPAYALGNNAYRISKGNNSIMLKMFSIDVHYFAQEKSIINYYFESCVFNQVEPDEFFTKNIKFKKDGKYPVLCYNLEFYPSGKIKSLSISKDVVMITDKYNTIYDKDDNLKELYNLFLKSVSKNGGETTDYDIYKINGHFEQLLTQKYIEFAQVNKMPLMYYGYSLPNEKDSERHLGDLAPYFSEIDKKNAKDIINIINSKIDQPHYSILPIENGVYDLKLIDSFNYLGLANQRMINDIYFNQRQLDNPVRLYKLKLEYLSKHYKKVMEINNALNYVDRFEIKETKGKIKRKLKI